MLFSNPTVASYINGNFEPAWQSVRPVPIVNIDFGGDASVTRTLHGNIATYICNAEGHVLDILPGAYEAHTYLSQLKQLDSLYREIEAVDNPLEQLSKYHAGQLAVPREAVPLRTSLTQQQIERAQQAVNRLADSSKVVIIEKPVELVLRGEPDSGDIEKSHNSPDLNSRLQASLARDTRYNELHRRRQIHQQLATANWLLPQLLTKWLYREVLNTDLDDPYLGTREVLFSDYPFADDGR
ncbi:MAG: hypothetical protein H6823_01175 [Planctomycetaceae bacterium]|nr:hypothetical protein [Planctomycetaceae bacterium]